MRSSSRSRPTSERGASAIARSALATLPFLLCARASAQDDAVQVFLEKRQALRAAFPEADRFLEWRRLLTGDETARVESAIGSRLADGGYLVFLALRAGRPVGLALITAEVGKVKPFAFMIATDPERRVRRIDVMDYRETHGGEVRRRVFLDQFAGRAPGAPLRLAREIDGIPGATLSSQAVCRGTRKCLVVLETWFGAQATDALVAAFERAGRDLPVDPPPAGATPVTAQRPALGSILAVVVWPAAGVDAAAAVEASFAEAQRLESILSTRQEGSPIARLNLAAGPVPQPPEAIGLLRDAVAAARESGGAFDPLARAGRSRGPSASDAVVIDEQHGTACLAVPGAQLDLDGIGKGFVVDRLVALLRSRGVACARVGFRSSFFCLGAPPGSTGHRVPLSDGTALLVRDQGVGVSGDEERGDAAGSRPIVDADGRRASTAGEVVVVAPSATEADWLSTAAFVLGSARGAELARGRHGDRTIRYLPPRTPAAADGRPR